MKLPEIPPLPLDLSLFWIKHGEQWEPCCEPDCYVPVMPDLRFVVEPRCWFHAYMSQETKRIT